MKRKNHPKKRQPVTFAEKKSSSTKSKRKLISSLHVALKDLEKVKEDSSAQPAEKTLKIQQLKHEIEELGGLEAYQQSSLLGEHLNGNVNTSKWVLEKLKEFNVRAEKGCKLRLLDVGALHLNYTKHLKWLEADAIDLNPQCEGIEKTDFFDYKVGESGIYDIIVLSLVVNFVSSPPRRGEMLRRCQQLCAAGGHVFLILPKACVENSRYLDHNLVHEMMEALTFDLVTQHASKKLSYKMFRKAERRKEGREGKKSFPKRELRNGKKCNNFTIVLR